MLQVEDAELVGAKCITMYTPLDCFHYSVHGEYSRHHQRFPPGIPRHYSGLIEEVCLPSFEVLNCWMNLVDSCLDDDNGIPLKATASLSALRFAQPSIPFIVLHSLVMSVFWSMVSTKSHHFLPFVYTYTVLDVFIRSWQFR